MSTFLADFSVDCLPTHACQTLTATSTSHHTQRVSAPAVILGDDSLLLKYLNPNLITCASEAASEDKAFVKIMVLDTVSGRIIHQQRHRHGSSPIHLTMFEVYVACRLVCVCAHIPFARSRVIGSNLHCMCRIG